MKETVLLTGGAGFIGSHIAVELLQRDYDVVIADDLSNSRPDVPERIEKITGRAPVFYRMDVSDRQALDRVFRAHDIAAAVHLAGYKAVGESVQKPLAYYRNNLDSTLALLEEMAQAGCTRFVFSSSFSWAMMASVVIAPGSAANVSHRSCAPVISRSVAMVSTSSGSASPNISVRPGSSSSRLLRNA